jgi:hypothetical protein
MLDLTVPTPKFSALFGVIWRYLDTKLFREAQPREEGSEVSAHSPGIKTYDQVWPSMSKLSKKRLTTTGQGGGPNLHVTKPGRFIADAFPLPASAFQRSTLQRSTLQRSTLQRSTLQRFNDFVRNESRISG